MKKKKKKNLPNCWKHFSFTLRCTAMNATNYASQSVARSLSRALVLRASLRPTGRALDALRAMNSLLWLVASFAVNSKLRQSIELYASTPTPIRVAERSEEICLFVSLFLCCLHVVAAICLVKTEQLTPPSRIFNSRRHPKECAAHISLRRPVSNELVTNIWHYGSVPFRVQYRMFDFGYSFVPVQLK